MWIIFVYAHELSKGSIAKVSDSEMRQSLLTDESFTELIFQKPNILRSSPTQHSAVLDLIVLGTILKASRHGL